MENLEWKDKVDGQDDIFAKDINAIADYANKLNGGKVDKKDGKGLSTNDFTDLYMQAVQYVMENLTKVDTALSTTSKYPVQNQAIAKEVHKKMDEGRISRDTEVHGMLLGGTSYKLRDTKAREMINNLPMQKIFETTTTEVVDVIDDKALKNLKLDEVYIHINLSEVLTNSADWYCYINGGSGPKHCLYYFAANKTGKHFVAKTERMCNGMWFTQKFSNLTNYVYNNNYISSYIMGEVDYITSLSIDCKGLPIGSTITVCGRKVVE